MEYFYVASSFKNIDSVQYVANQLISKGFIQTYDWTKNAKAKSKNSLTLKDLREIGQHEKDAVLKSDIVIVLLPGGKGTHIEFGIALGQGKKVYLHSLNGEVNDLENTSTFYHLPEVEKSHGSLDDLLNKITENRLVNGIHKSINQ